ncbi:uncharacterized protein LOC125462401 [Stegostoma tigrinum]|uniref:uncharacterized protein LOC125462401 n=1 Tax=Stegostoma tigrinum TaxID=3053191 RepID=UPI00287036B7|nr:uncharacterized protein LOC125462401 [Stegostoma tigrinum]
MANGGALRSVVEQRDLRVQEALAQIHVNNSRGEFGPIASSGGISNSCIREVSPKQKKANVIDSTNSYSLLLMDKADIQELPETTRRLLASNAVTGTDQSPDEENGPWKVGLDSPSFQPIMLYSTNRRLKEQLYRAFVSRAREGSFDNGALIEEIRKLRHEFSQILGYKNFAEYSISKNMAGSVERVWNFANTLRARSYPVAQQELRTLQRFANSHGHEGKLQQWDIDYWDELQSRILFSVTKEQLRQHFPLQRCVLTDFLIGSVFLNPPTIY